MAWGRGVLAAGRSDGATAAIDGTRAREGVREGDVCADEGVRRGHDDGCVRGDGGSRGAGAAYMRGDVGSGVGAEYARGDVGSGADGGAGSGGRAFLLDHVSVGYAGSAVLKDVSLTVRPGEVHCLLGPNGVGKTTLFRSALGLLPLVAVRVSIDGRDAGTLSDRELARVVAYVPQAAEIPFAFTVRDVVAMGRLSHMGVFASPGVADYAVVDGTLDRLGISRLAERSYTELSGGERQMALIARAVAQEPEYLLMDEPTAALDFGNQAQVLRCVRELAESGLGILMTTHTPDHLHLCRAFGTLIMRDGTYRQGDATELLTPELLSEAYGTEVMVVDADWRGTSQRFCRPVV